MKFRSTAHAYRTDNEDAHTDTTHTEGFYPLLYHSEDHDGAASNPTYTGHPLTGPKGWVAFVTADLP